MKPGLLIFTIAIIVQGLFSVLPPFSFATYPEEQKAITSDCPPKEPAVTNCESDLERFALLVGINEYEHVPKLNGPVKDVQDLRDILIKKFCFPPSQIVCLVDKSATHDRIVEAFRQHLIENAKRVKADGKKAVIVFQFSGHGSQYRDLDGDEPEDHLDETLVTVESNHRDGKNTDIIDDDLYGLFYELSAHTDNTTFILESCHSGSAMRGDSLPGNRSATLEVPMDKREVPIHRIESKGPDGKPPDDQRIDMLPRDKSYTTISSCTAEQLALAADGLKRQNSLMMFYLLRVLEHATPQTSYRQIWQEIFRLVNNDNPSQHPQVEGDLERFVFGGSASREDIFIQVLSVDAKGKKITINAGSAQGIRKGALIAIYPADAHRLTDQRITTATVVDVQGTSATATFDEQKDVSDKARAALISRGIAADRVKVALGEISNGSDDNLIASLAKKISRSDMLELANPNKDTANKSENAGWQVSVACGKFGEVFKDKKTLAPPEKGEQARDLPSDDAVVYYIASRIGNPMYGFFVMPSDPRRAEKILIALEKFAKQQDLKALTNESWPGNRDLKITVKRVIGQYVGNAFKATVPEGEIVKLADNQTEYAFDQGEILYFEIANQTQRELYVTVFRISTNGQVKIIYPRGPRERVVKGYPASTKDGNQFYRASGPPGYDTIKVIATTSPKADFSFLETDGVTRGPRSNLPSGKSVLEQIMEKALARQDNIKNRSSQLDQWTTAEIQLKISENEKQQDRR